VAGLIQLRFTAGTNSHGVTYAAQNNRAVLKQGTTDVTSTVVVNP
jgi:mannan endo-1,4-beta-mannosidase